MGRDWPGHASAQSGLQPRRERCCLSYICGIPCHSYRRSNAAPPQVRNSFGMSHEEITALAAKEAPGCSGATMLPYMLGERTPNWPQATGALLGECSSLVVALPVQQGRSGCSAMRQAARMAVVTQPPCRRPPQNPQNPNLQPSHPKRPLCWPSPCRPAGLRPGMLRPGLLFRAAMEGATFSLLAGMRRLQDYGLAAT